MFHLGSGSDGEHESGYSGTAEVQQATLEGKKKKAKQSSSI